MVRKLLHRPRCHYCGWRRRLHKPPQPLQVAAVRLENICENICPEPEGQFTRFLVEQIGLAHILDILSCQRAQPIGSMDRLSKRFK